MSDSKHGKLKVGDKVRFKDRHGTINGDLQGAIGVVTGFDAHGVRWRADDKRLRPLNNGEGHGLGDDDWSSSDEQLEPYTQVVCYLVRWEQ